MKNGCRVFLVRHGENTANITKEFSCRRIDYDLTDKGILQAEQTALYFSTIELAAVYSSPLKRAVQTAEKIAGLKGLDVEVIEDFREVNVGELENRVPDRDAWRVYFGVGEDWNCGKKNSRFPGGEDFFELRNRFLAGISRAVGKKDGKNIVIVGHGGMFAACVPGLCEPGSIGLTPGKANNNCSITELLVTKHGGGFSGRIVTWAEDGHLHGKAAEFTSGLPEFKPEAERMSFFSE